MKKFCPKSVPSVLCLATLLSASFLILPSASLAATKYWIGSGPGSFSDSSRWSLTTGGAGGVTAPGTADDAVFDGNGTGDCSIDSAISVKGLKLEGGYSGTLTQGAAITVGTNGYAQAGGTFVGGAADMTVYTFLLSGGSFTAPEGVMTIANKSTANINIFKWDGGSFNHNNGTLAFNGWIYKSLSYNHTIDLTGQELETQNLMFSGGNYYPSINSLNYQLGIEDKLVVHGDLLCEGDTDVNTNALIKVQGGVIELQGNLTVKDGMGGGTSTLQLLGDANQTFTVTGGQLVDTVIVDKESGSVTPVAGSVQFLTKTFIIERGDFTAPDGPFLAAVSYSQTGGTFTPGAGDMCVGTFSLSGGSFTAPEGVITIENDTQVNIDIFTWDGGFFNHNNGTLAFNGWIYRSSSYNHTIDLTGQELETQNLIFGGGNYYPHTSYSLNYQLGVEDKLVAHGDLLCEGDTDRNVNALIKVQGGVIELQGNLTVNNGSSGGTTAFTFTGANEQSLTHTGGTAPTTPWTIDKTGGKVSLATDFTLSGKTQDVYLNQGELNLDTNTFIVGRNLEATGDGPSALGVRVADADTAGLLVVSNNLTGIANLDLNVAVSAPSAEMKNQSYQIVTNKTDLSQGFKSVNWASPWKGKVDYSLGEGREAWLYDLDKKGGTVFVFR